MEVIAQARFVRISARKARLLRPLILNKEAEFAMQLLENTQKRGCKIVRKLIQSAIANGKGKSEETKQWYVKNFIVNEGPRMRRMRAAPQGRAVVIRKMLSHLTIVLEELPETKTRKEHGAKG
jgi:large subunit ribosomal protein L22